MKHNARAVQTLDRWIFWGLVALVGLIPILVYGTEIRNIAPTISGIGPMDTGMFANSYIIIKYTVLLLIAGCIALLFGYRVAGAPQTLGPSPLHGPLSALFLLILVSLLLSPFPTIALNGYYDLREGTITFLCYVTLTFIALNTTIPEKSLNAFLYALIPFVVVNGVLGALQLYGVNPIDWPGVKAWMYPPSVKTIPADIRFATTLGNANYASGFAGVCTVFSLTTALVARENRERNLALALALGSYTVILSSLSQSGFITLVIVSPLIALAAWRFGRGLQSLKTAAIALAGFLIIFAWAYAANPSVYNETIGFFTNLISPPAAPAAPSPEGPAVQTAPKGDDFPILAPSGWAFGTGRGYIWKRSLELIRERPLFGYGLDTISYTFPQFDPEKISGVSSGFVVITKPHSFFIALAYGAGVPAVLALGGIVAILLWQALKRAISNPSLHPVTVGILLATIAYLVQGLVNDSMIGYSVVFWVFLGVAASLLKPEIKQAVLPKKTKAG